MVQATLPSQKQATKQATNQPTLRPYQKSAVAKTYQYIKQGYTNPLIYAPTGSGKTVMASHIARDAKSKSRRVLFLVHRDALVKQTRDTLISYGIPKETIGYIKNGYPHATDEHQVIVASVQSLRRRNYPQEIGLIICDEAHTTAFYNDFATIRQSYQHDGQKGAIIIGLSASPWRNKSQEGMKHAGFDCLVSAATISGLIQQGFLAPPRYFGFGGMMDLSQFEVREGDYKPSQVKAACMAHEFNQKIVDEYLNIASSRTAIAFCASIEQSRYLAELFNEADIAAEHLEGDTPTDVREGMYQRLSSGETRVLCSVGTLTEGFDVKSIGAIILARPTKSVSLYVQVCGRGLRPYPGKEDCYILDFANVISTLGFLSDQPPPTLEPIKNGKKPQQEEEEDNHCPKCGAWVHKLAKICPECGEILADLSSGSSYEPPEDLFEKQFGELFDRQTQKKVDYLRKEIRRRFSKNESRDRIWALFESRYGHPPSNDWFYGAVFGRQRTPDNKRQFLNYLHQISQVQPPKQEWLDFHLRLEFGTQPLEDMPPATKWYEILRVDPNNIDQETLKNQYKELAKQCHPDMGGTDDDMKKLNWAMEEAQKALNR